LIQVEKEEEKGAFLKSVHEWKRKKSEESKEFAKRFCEIIFPEKHEEVAGWVDKLDRQHAEDIKMAIKINFSKESPFSSEHT
jgi:hypothetical protein